MTTSSSLIYIFGLLVLQLDPAFCFSKTDTEPTDQNTPVLSLSLVTRLQSFFPGDNIISPIYIYIYMYVYA